MLNPFAHHRFVDYSCKPEIVIYVHLWLEPVPKCQCSIIQALLGQFCDKRCTGTSWLHSDLSEKTMAQVALRWVLQRPAVTSVISGCRTVHQLEVNMEAVSDKWSLSDQEVGLPSCPCRAEPCRHH